MDVLYTGNVEVISQKFFDTININDKKVIFSETKKLSFEGDNIVVFDRGERQDNLRDVYTTFNFETVVYFSQALDGALHIFDELEKLESNLYFCRRNKVKNFVYVTANDLYKDNEAKPLGTSREILVEACDKLCQAFASENSINFIILRTPYIYSMGDANNQFNEWIRSAIDDRKLEFRAQQDAVTDFVCDEDLAVLIERILDEPNISKYCIMNISGDNEMTFKDFELLITEQLPDVKAEYKDNLNAIPGYIKNQIARNEFGWAPKHLIADDVSEVIERNEFVRYKRQQYIRRKARIEKIQNKVRIAIEMIVLFLLTEVLNHYTRDNVLTSFIDLRMIFVVIMGVMNGLNAGIIAAVLASMGYISDNAANMQWQIIFYNVQNWLPFACYFLLGSACGYNKDRHEDDTAYAKEQHDILEQKYIFLNDLYVQALDSKEAFNNQILGYKDSFGKIYSIVKRLNAVVPDKIFFEAINVLEELLENNSVAIYSINDKSDFARLIICSKSLTRTLAKSLKLSDYPKVLDKISQNKLFVNLEGTEGYPAYVAPIYRNCNLEGILVLKYAKNINMNTEFANKFSIVADLIRDSLFRAYDYNEQTYRYVDNTQFLEADAFEEIIKIKDEMRDSEYIDYVLLKIERGNRTLEEFITIVGGMIRSTDIMGLAKNGETYLLLSQTRRDNMSVVEERMKKNDIEFEVVKG